MLATIIRTIILYFVVTIAIRLMGKRQIGDMQPNELVVTLLISEIAAIPLQDSNQPIINGIGAISVLIIAEILLSALALKSVFIRRIMSGKATILIKDGKIDEKAMKRVRITVDDLLEMLRGKDVFDINEVEFAILEVNGELNTFLKPEYQTPTREDLKIRPDPEHPYLPVIIDKKQTKDYFEYLNTDDEKLQKIMKKNNLKYSDTLLLLADKRGNLIQVKKEKK